MSDFDRDYARRGVLVCETRMQMIEERQAEPADLLYLAFNSLQGALHHPLLLYVLCFAIVAVSRQGYVPMHKTGLGSLKDEGRTIFRAGLDRCTTGSLAATTAKLWSTTFTGMEIRYCYVPEQSRDLKRRLFRCSIQDEVAIQVTIFCLR